MFDAMKLGFHEAANELGLSPTEFRTVIEKWMNGFRPLGREVSAAHAKAGRVDRANTMERAMTLKRPVTVIDEEHFYRILDDWKKNYNTPFHYVLADMLISHFALSLTAAAFEVDQQRQDDHDRYWSKR